MFKEVLQSAIEKTEGSLGALIIGTDGLTVEKVWTNNPDTDLNIAIAEYTSLISGIKRINEEEKLGGFVELSITCNSYVFIMRMISNDYLVAMILSQNGNVGRGRYELYKAKLKLEQEFIN